MKGEQKARLFVSEVALMKLPTELHCSGYTSWDGALIRSGGDIYRAEGVGGREGGRDRG